MSKVNPGDHLRALNRRLDYICETIEKRVSTSPDSAELTFMRAERRAIEWALSILEPSYSRAKQTIQTGVREQYIFTARYLHHVVQLNGREHFATLKMAQAACQEDAKDRGFAEELGWDVVQPDLCWDSLAGPDELSGGNYTISRHTLLGTI